MAQPWYPNDLGPESRKREFEEVKSTFSTTTSTNQTVTTVTTFDGTMASLNHAAAMRVLGLGSRRKNPATRPDIGGPWFMEKREEFIAPAFYVNDNLAQTAGTIGWHLPSWPAESVYRNPNPIAISSKSDLISKGSTLMARSIPTDIREADISTMIGELKEGLPALIGASVMRNRVSRARQAGNEYLNYEFGWAPLIRDLQGLHRAVKNSDAAMQNLLDGSGKLTRTGSAFPEVTSSHAASTVGTLSGNNALTNASFTVQISDQWKQNTWFEGAWMYHLPVDTEFLGKQRAWLARADALYGAIPDPETVWNLAPWSWAADWFGNVGDLIALNSFIGKDGLVLRYGYVMQETVRTVTLSANHPRVGYMTRKRVYTTKQRYRASPYGFGVSWEGLSPKQLAIIAALGLSRS